MRRSHAYAGLFLLLTTGLLWGRVPLASPQPAGGQLIGLLIETRAKGGLLKEGRQPFH